MLEKNIANALACGFCISENVGYFLDEHSAENHPHELVKALVPKAADWLRPYADLGKRLRAFKEKLNDVKKHIAELVCDGDIKLVTNKDVSDYFMSKDDLRSMWNQHDEDIKTCYSFVDSYNKIANKCPKKLEMASFGSWYVGKLIAKAEKDFVPLYFDDTIHGVVENKEVIDKDFHIEKCKMIYVYFVDMDSDESREEPIYFNKVTDIVDDKEVERFQTLDEVIDNFLKVWDGIYNPNCGIYHSDIIEFDRKVKVWTKQQ